MAKATHKGVEATVHAALAGGQTQPALQYLGETCHPCDAWLCHVLIDRDGATHKYGSSSLLLL